MVDGENAQYHIVWILRIFCFFDLLDYLSFHFFSAVLVEELIELDFYSVFIGELNILLVSWPSYCCYSGMDKKTSKESKQRNLVHYWDYVIWLACMIWYPVELSNLLTASLSFFKITCILKVPLHWFLKKREKIQASKIFKMWNHL